MSRQFYYGRSEVTRYWDGSSFRYTVTTPTEGMDQEAAKDLLFAVGAAVEIAEPAVRAAYRDGQRDGLEQAADLFSRGWPMSADIGPGAVADHIRALRKELDK